MGLDILKMEEKLSLNSFVDIVDGWGIKGAHGDQKHYVVVMVCVCRGWKVARTEGTSWWCKEDQQVRLEAVTMRGGRRCVDERSFV